MLVLSRKHGERILLNTSDGPIWLSVERVNADRGTVRLGFDAPSSVEIIREELWDGAWDRQRAPKPAEAACEV